MMSSTSSPLSVRFQYAYNATLHYASVGYQKSRMTIINSYHFCYPRLLEIGTLVKHYLSLLVEASKNAYKVILQYVSKGYQKGKVLPIHLYGFCHPHLVNVGKIVKRHLYLILEASKKLMTASKKVIALYASRGKISLINKYHALSLQVAAICHLAKTHLYRFAQATKNYFLTHQREIMVGVAVGISMGILHHMWEKARKRKRLTKSPAPVATHAIVQNNHHLRVNKDVEVQSILPPDQTLALVSGSHQSHSALRPEVVLSSTLNIAKLHIRIPKELKRPPDIALTFCIDTSPSMNTETRLEQVKVAMKNVLDRAQEVVNTVDKAIIRIAIVTFNTQAHLFQEGITLTRTKSDDLNPPITLVKRNLEKLYTEGGTNTLNGLILAVDVVEKMAKSNTSSAQSLILLSDGEDSSVVSQTLNTLQRKLVAVNANLFAIGIGNTHNKNALNAIASSHHIPLKGTYIDTTIGKETIGSAIINIYDQAVACFKKFELSTSLLGAGSWSVNQNLCQVQPKGQTTCSLGSLSEDTELKATIVIHGEKLPTQIELSNLNFTLTYLDPKGSQYLFTLPWNPTTTINPALFRS